MCFLVPKKHISKILWCFQNIMMLFQGYCCIEKIIVSLSLSNLFSPNWVPKVAYRKGLTPKHDTTNTDKTHLKLTIPPAIRHHPSVRRGRTLLRRQAVQLQLIAELAAPWQGWLGCRRRRLCHRAAVNAVLELYAAAAAWRWWAAGWQGSVSGSGRAEPVAAARHWRWHSGRGGGGGSPITPATVLPIPLLIAAAWLGDVAVSFLCGLRGGGGLLGGLSSLNVFYQYLLCRALVLGLYYRQLLAPQDT